MKALMPVAIDSMSRATLSDFLTTGWFTEHILSFFYLLRNITIALTSAGKQRKMKDVLGLFRVWLKAVLDLL
jgi:hypothetical protein